MKERIAVVGGGAAGFFAALSAKSHHPQAELVLFEKSSKLLAKVKISGGGRCNVTNGFQGLSGFAKHYPRGEKQLKKAFSQFNSKDTLAWFESRGVKLKQEADGRIFPVTNNSQTIIDCLLEEARSLNIEIRTSTMVKSISAVEGGFELTLSEGIEHFKAVIVTTGGQPKSKGFDWLRQLGHQVIDPVPSLFTFNMPKNPITKLMGLTIPYATVRVQGTKLIQEGPLLITHWGMSGPAILKCSAWGARMLNEMNYQFTVHVNWLGNDKMEEVSAKLTELKSFTPKKKIKNLNQLEIPQRLWDYLLEVARIDVEKPAAELSKKEINRLVEYLTNDQHQVSGKTTFKEEFVTSGGIDLAEIDFKTMESRVVPKLFFAGEVLNLDGVTGGFNFQAAWTTGFIAGKHVLV